MHGEIILQKAREIPPAPRGDEKWRGTRLVLTLKGYKWKVGWGVMFPGWARSWDLHYFYIVMVSFPGKS